MLPTVSAEAYANSTAMMGRGDAGSLRGPKPKATRARFGCSQKMSVIPHENYGKGQPVQTLRAEDMRPAQRRLKECLKDMDKCDTAVAYEAAHLQSIQMLIRQAPVRLGHLHQCVLRLESCAIVGNAGHMSLKKYGQYIDRHEAVVRFNAQALKKAFHGNVGTKTTLRVINHARSRDACCSQRKFPQDLPDKANVKNYDFLLWHPGAQKELALACRKMYKRPVHALTRNFIMSEVAVMQALRRDARRFGMVGFKEWRQLTSGGHAVLLMTRMCKHVSLYGVSTWPARVKVPDQYGGRTKRTTSGNLWHDWVGESFAWRLLHAAGKITVCSN